LTHVWGIMTKATILVVEDDHNLMQGICDILELQEYRVLTAANGLDGMEVMNSCTPPPDLIVSDIMMPGMNGYEFFEAVRNEERWMSIPFIFLTAKSEKADVRAGKSMGADDYVIKPFDAEDLVIAVDAKLRRSKELGRVRDSHISDVKRQIMVILNHEFRTPLTFVVAYADMLHRDADELSYDEVKTFLTGVNAGADRLRRLIENFILLVELETGEAVRTFAWRKRPFSDYRALFIEAMTRAQEMAEEKNVHFQLDLPEDELPPVMADGEYLKAAVMRLVDNAVKFNDKPDGVVLLSAYVEDNCVCLSVTDQGRGIPLDQIEAIFEPFYQVDRDTYEDQGAGTGLPIVRGIATIHGGRVEVSSTPGEGSQFVIRLPVVDN
jgi:two-component system sensor histidine kinase/response regulator